MTQAIQRKIIQIVSHNDPSYLSEGPCILALCDDGSLWRGMEYTSHSGWNWVLLPGVTQDPIPSTATDQVDIAEWDAELREGEPAPAVLCFPASAVRCYIPLASYLGVDGAASGLPRPRR